MIIDILNQIKNTSSTNDKIDLLKFYADMKEPSDLLKKLLKLIYDPKNNFGISSKQVKLQGSGALTTFPVNLYSELLRTERRTDKLTLIRQQVGFCRKDVQEFFMRGLDKNLGIGMSDKSINKAFPDLIPIAEIMLASPQNEEVFNRVFADTDYLYMNQKIDGIRLTDDTNKCEFLSREDKEISEFVLENIRAESNELLPKGMKFDGELHTGKFSNLMKVIHRKEFDTECINIRNTCVYSIFDVIDKTMTLDERVKYLQELKDGKYIRFLKYYKVKKDYELICEMARKFIRAGCEGIMIKHPKSLYEFKRSHMWMKFKNKETEDVRIIGFKEGGALTKYEGMLGAFVVDYYGVSVDVGSGFTDDQRKEFWGIRNSLIDTMIEISYIERTKDGSLRHPVFERLRPDRS